MFSSSHITMKNRKPDNPNEFIRNTDSHSICHTLKKKKDHISDSLATSILFYDSKIFLFTVAAFRTPVRDRHRNMVTIAVNWNRVMIHRYFQHPYPKQS